MTAPLTPVDYHGFHIKRINEPQFRHLWWLLFWPVYWLRYPIIENLNPSGQGTLIYCPFDDLIPFQEWFLIPYMLWMVCMVAMCLYCLRYDIETFLRYSRFLVIAMSISTVIFLIFPSYQDLRPSTYPRDNFMTDLVAILHTTDTNTNVFPSEHIIGAIAVWIAAFRAKGLQNTWVRIGVSILMTLVCLSTLFLKQHSVLDILAALPICLFSYFLCFRKKTP